MRGLQIKLTDDQEEKLLKSLENRGKAEIHGVGVINLRMRKNNSNFGGPDEYPVLTFTSSRRLKDKAEEFVG